MVDLPLNVERSLLEGSFHFDHLQYEVLELPCTKTVLVQKKMYGAYFQHLAASYLRFLRRENVCACTLPRARQMLTQARKSARDDGLQSATKLQHPTSQGAGTGLVGQNNKSWLVEARHRDNDRMLATSPQRSRTKMSLRGSRPGGGKQEDLISRPVSSVHHSAGSSSTPPWEKL